MFFIKKYILEDEGMKEVYCRTENGETTLIKKGDVIKRENFAETLKIISRNPNDFYEGNLAEDIVNSVKKVGGTLELSDLKGYRVREKENITGEYKNYKITAAGLPTSGIFIVFALNILENFDMEQIVKERGGPYIFYLMVEIFKFMSSKRGEFADPDFMKNKEVVQKFLSKNL